MDNTNNIKRENGLIIREFVNMAWGNIRRQKLRSILTISGIMVGIGALVAMLSFAAGIEYNVSKQFEELDLFNTLNVFPASKEKYDQASDSLEIPLLNKETLAEINKIEGVKSAVPRETFDAELILDTLKQHVSVQSMPYDFIEGRAPGKLIAGDYFRSDSAKSVVISKNLLDKLGMEQDSILGKSFTLKTTSSAEIMKALVVNRLDDMAIPEQIKNTIIIVMERVSEANYKNEAELTVCGIIEINPALNVSIRDIILPTGATSSLDYISFKDPASLMSMLSSPGKDSWSMIEVVVDRKHTIGPIRDQIEAMGFKTFSFAEEFDQIKKSFLIFDLMVATLSFIAIFVASLGIVNTMVMSIVERTREIGILKSLGGEEGHIRLLFQVESIMIGLMGSLSGIALGWIVSRILSFALKMFLAAKDSMEVEAFMLTPLIVLIAIGFGITVSFLAGLYPAARASRIDAVEALRHE